MLPSIVQTVKYQYEQKQEQKQEQDYTKVLLNYRHLDGRIYASSGNGDDNYLAVSVSPYHPKFETQIENGIKEIVMSLLNKNYITLSSCEGHDKGWNSMMVKLAFVTHLDREQFLNYFKHIKNISFVLSDTASNVRLYFVNNKLKAERIEPSSNKYQIDGINDLYLRKHKSYCFLDIYVFRYDDGLFSFFSRRYTKYKKKKFLEQTKQQILEAINKIPQYEK